MRKMARIRAASQGPHAYAWPALGAVLLLAAVSVGENTQLVHPGNWNVTLGLAMPFVLVAMAQAPALISGNGGLDLSVGPVAGLVSVVIVGVLVPAGLGAPEIVLPVGIGIGVAAGCVNGLIIAYGRVPPIVTTLGSYLFFSGLTSEIMPTAQGTAPAWLASTAGSFGPVPKVLSFCAASSLIWIGLQKSSFRRNLFAVGGDVRAAYTSGVPVARTQVLTYVVSGALSAIAGLALVAVLNSADPTVGPPYTLISLTGAVLGGLTLAGGRGGLLGAAMGGMILYLAQNLLSLANVAVFELPILYGGMLLAALAANSAAEARRKGQGRRSTLLSPGEPRRWWVKLISVIASIVRG